MPLKLVRRHGSPYWYMRGSINGIRVDESAGTDNEKQAREILAHRQSEIYKRAIYGDSSVRTFAEAALAYIQGGGDGEFLGPILRRIGRKKLSEISQSLIEDIAPKLYKAAGPATLNRKVYTPISAVMHKASRLQWCPKPNFARPKQPEGRIRWVERDEARALIASAAPHLKPLVTFLFSTGCRIGEALYLDWNEVDLSRGVVHFLKTKNGMERYIALPPEAVSALANLPQRDGAVFRTQKGLAYEDREGEGGGQVKTAWRTMCKNAGISNFSPHDCRHTFATWYLRDNPEDYIGLMKQGGWKSIKMVMRYAHINVDDVMPRVSNIWGKSGGDKISKRAKPKLISVTRK